MKKVLKVLSIILLIISVIIVSIIVFFNLFIIIKILFWGMTVGGNVDSIWFGKTTLYGLEGIERYYRVWRELVYIFELPISLVCIIYQVIYFKKIRKNVKRGKI